MPPRAKLRDSILHIFILVDFFLLCLNQSAAKRWLKNSMYLQILFLSIFKISRRLFGRFNGTKVLESIDCNSKHKHTLFQALWPLCYTSRNVKKDVKIIPQRSKCMLNFCVHNSVDIIKEIFNDSYNSWTVEQ